MKAGRDGRIDLYRGLALVFIFWDHVPGSLLGLVSPRNLGLSDAAETFVFLAGYSAALAYGGAMARDGWLPAAIRVLRRAWTLYVAHIFLMVLLMGVVFVANARVETRDFVAEMHLGYFVLDTEQALVDALTLRFKPNLMDPLPLYILLLLAMAALLPGLMKARGLVLGASGLLYALTLLLDWNMPGQRGEWWFFNPLAWQFLFLLGAAAALRAREGRPWRLPRPLLAAAIGYLLLSALLALSWRFPELHDAIMPRAAAELIYPISKTSLAPLRLLHALALAAVVAAWVPAGPWLDRPLSRNLRRIGRHSLEVFCLGVILAPMADIGNTLLGDRIPVQILTGFGGVGIMFAFALLIEWSRAVIEQARLSRAAT
ncbi:OpgC domain-containing protein [Azospirillum sp. SYSU D00513]|uniref:OpgC family protein n=1 Tax=Azospirillum sp. SYSU D00513 TaxID=2812561 RepID=UPI001A962A25|nr:OpgC domain-containing protein [Azospirillum sp. SYSU D00513]